MNSDNIINVSSERCFLRMSRETTTEGRSISARHYYRVGVVRRKEDVAVIRGLALFCAGKALSESSRCERSEGVSSHIQSGR